MPRFRAFTKGGNRISFIQMEFDGAGKLKRLRGEVLNENESYSGPELDDIVIVMSTELEDRRGIEIWEGDQVRWDGGVYVITFSRETGSWILKDDRPDFDCPELFHIRSPLNSRIEVIRNIYDNPGQES